MYLDTIKQFDLTNTPPSGQTKQLRPRPQKYVAVKGFRYKPWHCVERLLYQLFCGWNPKHMVMTSKHCCCFFMRYSDTVNISGQIVGLGERCLFFFTVTRHAAMITTLNPAGGRRLYHLLISALMRLQKAERDKSHSARNVNSDSTERILKNTY